MRLSEYLSPDILGPNIVRCFLPIHFTQWLVGTNRINIKANFAMPITRMQKIYSLILAVLVAYACFLVIGNLYDQYHKSNRPGFLMGSLGVSINYVIYISSLLHVRFTGHDDSIRLFVLLQKIDRMLGLTHSKRAFKNHFYGNWVILVISCLHVPIVVLNTLYDINVNIMIMFSAIMQIVTNIEVMYVASLLYYLAKRLAYFNKALMEHKSVKEKTVLINSWIKNGQYVNGIGRSPTHENKNLFVTLELILAAFNVINKLGSFQILLLGISAFIWPLMVVQAVTLGLRSQLLLSWMLSVVMLSVWAAIYFLLIICLSVVCDRFQKQINHTKVLCIDLLSICHEGPNIKYLSDMLAIIEWEEPKFSVYGIFTLDRFLPLNLFSLIVAYIIILIQFTLL